ncbi:phospholipase/carboxylesterase [Pedobacter sp. UYP24]
MNYQSLKYIYKASGNPDANTLLLLHGTGGNEKDLISLGESFGANINLLSVRGNVSERGMPRFFKRLGMGIFDEKDIAFRTDELLAFLQDTAVKEGFDISKLIALGYSNGANIAGAMLIKYPNALAGAILFRPMQPFKELGTITVENAVPIFITNGAADPTVDPKSTANYLKALLAGGFNVESVSLPAKHNLTQQDVTLALNWYSKYFSYIGV